MRKKNRVPEIVGENLREFLNILEKARTDPKSIQICPKCGENLTIIEDDYSIWITCSTDNCFRGHVKKNMIGYQAQ